jgi:hypothetical protein
VPLNTLQFRGRAVERPVGVREWSVRRFVTGSCDVSVIETVTFRLAADTDEAEFLAADRRVQTEFLYHQPGLVRRTTARDRDGGWIVIVLWRSESDADAAATLSEDDRPTSELVAMLDGTTVETRRYATLD